jgi:hypothetical protein
MAAPMPMAVPASASRIPRQPHQFAPLRSEGHTDAELAGAACYFVWEQSVEADARQYQRQERKKARQAGDEPFLKERLLDLRGLCSHGEEGQVVVGLRDDGSHLFHQRERLAGGAQLKVGAARHRGQEHGGFDFVPQLVVPGVGDNADDEIARLRNRCRLIFLRIAHMSAHGILVGEVLPGKRLIEW